MIITLIRHAESTFNSYGDLSRDCSITLKGIKQASKLNGYYDLIVCSTLKRARQTLDFSSIKYGELIFTDKCREIKDGRPINIYNGENKEKLFETEQEINKRIEEFINLLKELNTTYKNIAVISHKMFSKRLYNKILNKNLKNLKNCEKIEIEIEI